MLAHHSTESDVGVPAPHVAVEAAPQHILCAWEPCHESSTDKRHVDTFGKRGPVSHYSSQMACRVLCRSWSCCLPMCSDSMPTGFRSATSVTCHAASTPKHSSGQSTSACARECTCRSVTMQQRRATRLFHIRWGRLPSGPHMARRGSRHVVTCTCVGIVWCTRVTLAPIHTGSAGEGCLRLYRVCRPLTSFSGKLPIVN